MLNSMRCHYSHAGNVNTPTPNPPSVRGIDHVHVYVKDRDTSEAWYKRVLGLARIQEYEAWAVDGGPLTVANAEGTVHIALFERTTMKNRSIIALGVSAAEFMKWKAHLQQVLAEPPAFEDHEMAFSLYFSDPDGNPYEITTYEHQAVRDAQVAIAA